jgi:hypothetical protein
MTYIRLSPLACALFATAFALGTGCTCGPGPSPDTDPGSGGGAEAPDAGVGGGGGGGGEAVDSGARDAGKPPPLDSGYVTAVEVTPAVAQEPAGIPVHFVAEYISANGSRQPVPDAEASWTAAPGTVARVDGGAAVGLQPGVATISVAASGFTGSAQFTVTSAEPVSGFKVDPPDASVDQGAFQVFTATATYSDGVDRQVPGVDWHSADASVATIDAVTGVASGQSPGSVTITANSQTGGFSATAKLTVLATPPAPGQTGSACTAGGCAPGLTCLTGPEWPNGYCSRDCTADRGCPAGSSCYPVGGQGSTFYCVQNCAPASDGGTVLSSCRAGYCCFYDSASNAGGCFASGGVSCL